MQSTDLVLTFDPEACYNTHMDHYALVISKEQKELIVKATEMFSQMPSGQTSEQREAARKLLLLLRKLHHNGTNDLSK